MDEIQAAFLREKIKKLDQWNQRRKAIANEYINKLGDIKIVLPSSPDWAESVWHLFVIRYQQRDQLQKRLNDAGIGTMIHYPIPPHLQEAYIELGFISGSFPIAELIHREVLSLPIGPHLDKQQLNAVINAVKDAVRA